MIKFLKHLILILSLLGVQLAIIPAAGDYLTGMNVVLTVLVFICVAYKFSLGVVYAFIVGFVLDLYSALPFGAILVALLLTLYVIHQLSLHFLTNKSFYALIGLTFIAIIVNSLISYLYLAGFYFFQTSDLIVSRILVSAPSELLHQLGYNLALTVILFAVFHFTSRRFNAVFIDTTKN
ncbi:MAG: rod shape-determining protein MreD [Patescibacteria group bacterium]